jgi:hypothetical protein
MSTYKTTDPAALAALAKFHEEAQVARSKFDEFAQHFGAVRPIISNDIMVGYRLRGLLFKPAKDIKRWTVPDKQVCGAQRPRATLKAGTKEERAMLKGLNNDWQARFPKDLVKWDAVLKALGTDSGYMFLCGFYMFEFENAIYLETTAPLAPHCTEILGSVYSAAKAAYELRKQS